MCFRSIYVHDLYVSGLFTFTVTFYIMNEWSFLSFGRGILPHLGDLVWNFGSQVDSKFKGRLQLSSFDWKEVSFRGSVLLFLERSLFSPFLGRSQFRFCFVSS